MVRRGRNQSGRKCKTIDNARRQYQRDAARWDRAARRENSSLKSPSKASAYCDRAAASRTRCSASRGGAVTRVGGGEGAHEFPRTPSSPRHSLRSAVRDARSSRSPYAVTVTYRRGRPPRSSVVSPSRDRRNPLSSSRSSVTYIDPGDAGVPVARSISSRMAGAYAVSPRRSTASSTSCSTWPRRDVVIPYNVRLVASAQVDRSSAPGGNCWNAEVAEAMPSRSRSQ